MLRTAILNRKIKTLKIYRLDEPLMISNDLNEEVILVHISEVHNELDEVEKYYIKGGSIGLIEVKHTELFKPIILN